MKVLKSRKSVIAALALSAIALTGCGRVNTVEYNGELYNIEDNSLLKGDEDLTIKDRLTYKSSGLSVSLTSGQFNNQLDIKYDKYPQADDNVYDYINNVVNNMTEDDTLSIHISKGNLDYSKIDVSKFKRLEFDVADVDFDYKPFYNNTYISLSLKISDKTNIDSIVTFLENVKTEKASIFIDFVDNTSVEDSQKVIDALAKLNGVDSISLYHSNINELNIADLACHTLFLHHPTTSEKLNYDFTLNNAVEFLFVSSAFNEEYDGESYLESFKVNSKNENLSTHYQIFRCAGSNGFNIKADQQSVIDIPDNTELDILGLDISEVGSEWLNSFSNLKCASISPYSINDYSFIFNNESMTIDEAISEKEYNDTKERVNKQLEEIGISYRVSPNQHISIDASYNSTGEKVPKELYTILKREFENPSNDYLYIYNLNNQFAFSKVDLSNITTASFDCIGPDFDFTPFYNQNISNLKLVIGDDANHENILEFLKNIRDIYMKVNIRFEETEKCEDPELIQQYVDVLSTKNNLVEVEIDAQMVNNVNYENLVTEKLSLFVEPYEDVINYDISINDQVQYFTINTYYDEDYSNKVYIGDINVNSNNKGLITDLFFNCYDFDGCFNVNLERITTKITVPNDSGLRISGVDFDSIDYEAIEALDYLRYLYIAEDGNEDYAFCHHYLTNTFDEALKEFIYQNRNRKGASLTNNNY